MPSDKIFAINDVLVRDEIVEIPFSCDLKKCKGACCTLESELGAPVIKAEIEEIEKILPVIKRYLLQTNIDEIEEQDLVSNEKELGEIRGALIRGGTRVLNIIEFRSRTTT